MDPLLWLVLVVLGNAVYMALWFRDDQKRKAATEERQDRLSARGNPPVAKSRKAAAK